MQDLPIRQKLVIMAGVMLGLFFSSLSETTVTTAMPRIVADLGGLDRFSWVFITYILTSTIGIPIFGKLSDIYGRKSLYLGSMLVFMAGSALAGLSQNMEQLIAFRTLQGLGGGGIMAIGFTIIGDIFSPQERGRWEGIVAGTFGISIVVGPLVGGYITDHFSWAWVFYVNLPMGAIALGVLWFILPSARGTTRPAVDYMGAAALIGALSPTLLALLWGGVEYDWSSPVIIGLFVAGASLTAVFLWAENRAAEPIIPLELFGGRVFAVSMVAVFLSGAAMFSLTAYLPLFMQAVVGLSATNSGLVIMPLMLGLIVTAIGSGALLSQTGRYKAPLLVGMAVLSLGLYLTTRMGPDASRFETVRNMFIAGVGLGPSMPLFLIVVQNSLPHRYLGVGTSSVQFFRQMGGLIGVAITGTVLNNRLSSELETALPQAVREGDPALVERLGDPQVLLNDQAAGFVRQLFAPFGEGADALFAQSMEAVRVSLAESLTTVFWFAFVAAVLAFLAVIVLPEIALRTSGDILEELASADGAGLPEGGGAPALAEPSLGGGSPG